MIITPLGTAAPPKKCKIKTIAALTGGSAGGTADARSQEKSENPERPGGPRQEPKLAVVDAPDPELPLPFPLKAQEPERPKRRRDADASSEISWVSKKPRSAVSAARERGHVIAETNRAAAEATSSAIVQGPAMNMDGREPIGKKSRPSPGGSNCRAVGDHEEEHVRSCVVPCVVPSPVHGLDHIRQGSEAAVLNDIVVPSRRAKKSSKRGHHYHQIVEEASRQIKRSYSASALVVCEGSNGAVDQETKQVFSVSDPSTGRTLESASGSLPTQRRHCKTAKHPDRKTTRQPFMSLSPELQRLGLTNVTPIVSKVLTNTDCNFNAHRLLLPRQSILDSPLMSMLTQEEHEAVYREDKKTKDGESLEVLDQHGRRYQMNFKFLDSDKQYRLIGQWTKFVEHNGMRKGDLVEVGAFRSGGNLRLMLLHHAMEEQASEETGEAEGTKEELMLEKIEAAEGVGEEQTSADMEEAGSVKEWTLEELEAAKGLLALSHFKDGTKL